MPTFRFRLGVTDLIALSWMPELLNRIMERYPTMTFEPEIDLTTVLLEKLAEQKLDFVICPRVSQDPHFISVPLGKIDLAWMCSPKLVEGIENVSLADLTDLPLLIQTKGSVLRPILHGVIDNQTLPFKRTISCNNMAALAHLAGRGMGVTLLPLAFFRQMVLDGKLCVVEFRHDAANPRVLRNLPKRLLRRVLRGDHGALPRALRLSPRKRFAAGSRRG